MLLVFINMWRSFAINESMVIDNFSQEAPLRQKVLFKEVLLLSELEFGMLIFK